MGDASVAPTTNDLSQSFINQQEKHKVAVRFLDHELFDRSQTRLLSTLKTWKDVPSYVIPFVDSYATSQQIAIRYYQLVDPWLPIISKKKVFDTLINPLVPLRVDAVFLVLCMALLAGSEEDITPCSTAYRAAKELFMETEMAGITSLETLQGCILLTTYEHGHAIYPSAHTMIGVVVQLAQSLGMGWDMPRSASTGDWLDQEEERRTWRATYLLERFALSSRPCTTAVGADGG